MQGAINIDTAKQYLGKHKPAILALQETRLSSDNTNSFYHKDYTNLSNSPDLMLFIRKDIKTTPTIQPTLPFPCDIIKIQGENSFIHLANTYVRDNLLQCKDLNFLFNNYPNLLLIGDLNAKHKKISPHNQKIPYNSNGKQLYTYIQGLDDPALSPPPVTIHNLICSNEWTHITEAGTHSQIDYIISSSTTSHLYQNTEYEEELLSDHKGISVRSPLLFPEFHTQSTKKCIHDWSSFDNWAYKLISETELDT